MLVFKLSLGNDIRRIALESTPEFDTFRMLVRTLFTIPGEQNFSLLYTDEEGDSITVTTKMELDEAVRMHRMSPATSLRIVVGESSPLSSNAFSFVPVEASISGDASADVVGALPQPESKSIYPVVDVSPVAVDAPSSEPCAAAPVSEPSASAATDSHSRELTVLETLEKQLQEAFRAVKMFMQTLDIDVKILDAVETAQRKLKSAGSAVEKEIIDPLAALTKVKADDFTQQLSKLEKEIIRIKEQIKSELARAADSISAHFSASSPSPSAASKVPSEQELQDMADKFANAQSAKEPAAPEEPLPPTAALEDMQRLAEMGFTDRKRNLVLLDKHAGNLMAVVEELLN